MSSPDDRLACLADRAAVALFVAACHGKQDICSRLIQSGQYALAAVEDVIKAPFTRYNRLSCIVYTAGCQASSTTRFDNRLNKQWLNRLNEQWLFVQHCSQTGCLTTGLTNGCIV